MTRLALAIAAAALFAGFWSPPVSYGADSPATKPGLLVVVGPRSSLENVSTVQLRQVFLLQSKQIDGVPALPFNHPHSSAHRSLFDKRILGMDPNQTSRYWVDRLIRDTTKAPRSIASLKLLVAVVARLDGAISYVPPEAASRHIKVLKVDGKAPGDPDYPL